MLTPEQEAACLHWFPFADDFGEPGDRVLRDKVTTARKAGPCFDCKQPIAPGERTRSLSAKFGGELKRYRWCAACCAEMAAGDYGWQPLKATHPAPYNTAPESAHVVGSEEQTGVRFASWCDTHSRATPCDKCTADGVKGHADAAA